MRPQKKKKKPLFKLTSCRKSATPFLSGHLKPIDSKNSSTCSLEPWYTIWPSEMRIMSQKDYKSLVLAGGGR